MSNASIPYARASSRILVARAMRGRSEPLRISPRHVRTRRKLFRPRNFVLRRRQTLIDDGALVGCQADLAGHPELGGDRRGLDQFQRIGADGRAVDRAGQVGGLGGDGEARSRVGQRRRVVPKPVSRRKSPIPNASRKVPLVAAISVMRSRPGPFRPGPRSARRAAASRSR